MPRRSFRRARLSVGPMALLSSNDTDQQHGPALQKLTLANPLWYPFDIAQRVDCALHPSPRPPCAELVEVRLEFSPAPP
jgi:hypothetical protein